MLPDRASFDQPLAGTRLGVQQSAVKTAAGIHQGKDPAFHRLVLSAHYVKIGYLAELTELRINAS